MASFSKLDKLIQSNEQLGSASSAMQRLVSLFDEGSFTQLDAFAKNGENPASVITGYGTVEGTTVYAFSQDSSVMSGAVTKIHAGKIKKVYEFATKTGSPVVGFYDSFGADIESSNEALDAYGEMLLYSNNLSGVVPQISIVTGTCAGSAAMLAASADIVIMNSKAELFLTPPFVSSAKGDKVEGAGSAENAAAAGVAHLVTEDEEEAIEKARQILSVLPANNLSTPPYCEFEEAAANASLDTICENIDSSYDIMEVLSAVADADSILQLQPAFGKAAVTAFATMAGTAVGLVASNSAENNGFLDKNSASKMARFVRLCDSFSIPIITFVDTKGFVQSQTQETMGAVREAAKLAHAYAEATTVKISVVIGYAVGPAYIAFAGRNANADISVAWPGAVISAVLPETAVSILWKERYNDTDEQQLVTEYKDTIASPFEAAAGAYIDQIVQPSQTRGVLIGALDALAGKRVSKLPKKHGNIQL